MTQQRVHGCEPVLYAAAFLATASRNVHSAAGWPCNCIQRRAILPRWWRLSHASRNLSGTSVTLGTSVLLAFRALWSTADSKEVQQCIWYYGLKRKRTVMSKPLQTRSFRAGNKSSKADVRKEQSIRKSELTGTFDLNISGGNGFCVGH